MIAKLLVVLLLLLLSSLTNGSTAEVPTYEVSFKMTEQVDVNSRPMAVEEARITIFKDSNLFEKVESEGSLASISLPEGTYLVVARTSTCKTGRVIEVVAGETPQLHSIDCQQQ